MIKYWLNSILFCFSLLHAGLPTGSVHFSLSSGEGIDSAFVLLEHTSGRFQAGASLSGRSENTILLPTGGWIAKQCVARQTSIRYEQFLNCEVNGVYVNENEMLSVDVKLAPRDTIALPILTGCADARAFLIDRISGPDGWVARSRWTLFSGQSVQIPSSLNHQTFVHHWEIQCGDAWMKIGPVEPRQMANRLIHFTAEHGPSSLKKLQMGLPPWSSGDCNGFQGMAQMDSSLLTALPVAEWGSAALGEPVRWIPTGSCAQENMKQGLFRVWRYSGIPSLPDLAPTQRYTTPSPVSGLAQKNVRFSALGHQSSTDDGAFWSWGNDPGDLPFVAADGQPIRGWFYDQLRWKNQQSADSLTASWSRIKNDLSPGTVDSSGSAFLGVNLEVNGLDSVHEVSFHGIVERSGKIMDSMDVRLDGNGVTLPLTLPMYFPAGLVQGWLHLKRENGWLAMQIAPQHLQDGDSLQIDVAMVDQWNWSLPIAETCFDPREPLSIALNFKSMEPIDSISVALNQSMVESLPVLGAYQAALLTEVSPDLPEGRYPVLSRVKMRSGRESSLERQISMDTTQPQVQWANSKSVILVSPDSVWIAAGVVSDKGSGLRSAFFTDQPTILFNGNINDSVIVNTLSGSRVLVAEDRCGFVHRDTLSFEVHNQNPVAQLGSCDTLRAIAYSGGELHLDASLSTDADDYVKEYHWFFNGASIGNSSLVSWLPGSGSGDLVLQVKDRYGAADTATCFIDSIRKGFKGICGTASPDLCGICEDPSLGACTDLSRQFASGPEWALVQFSSADSILTVRLETCTLTAFEDDQILYLNTDMNAATGSQGMDLMLVWDYFRPGSADSVRVLLSRWDIAAEKWTVPSAMNDALFSLDISNGTAAVVAEIAVSSAIHQLKWSLEGGRYQLGSRFLPFVATGIQLCAGGSCENQQ